MSSNSKPVLVLGGGISGLSTAVEASAMGLDVVLVEKNPYLGGRVAQMHHYFPKLCPPTCGLEISLRHVRKNGKIRTITQAEVEKVSGEAGSFTATVRKQPRFVNERCTACGECADVCPEERMDAFNLDMQKTKAIYLPYKQAFPYRFVIDGEACKRESCEKCAEACSYDAIDLGMKAETEEIEASAVVFATGWDPYDASKLEELGYGKHPDIVTNLMMERLADKGGPTGGKVLRPSDKKEIESIAFVQCAGSRDENHLKHCSGACCLGSLKQVTYVREQYPDARIYVFYIDIRAPGRLEDFYQARQQDEKLTLIKGKVARIEAESGDLVVVAEDVLGGGRMRQKVNLVVLATGMVPARVAPDVDRGLKRDEHGFLLDDQGKPGLLAAGCAKRPLDVAACVRDATGMALKALQTSR